MSGQWKPGMVAMATVRGVPNVRVMFRGRKEDNILYPWASGVLPIGDSSSQVSLHIASEVADARPLVVLDPEDPEQVTAFVNAFLNFGGSLLRVDVSVATVHDNLAAALRSLIQPPKPDEPRGLGAVVEDAEGRRWVRGRDLAHHWHPADGEYANGAGPWRRYDDVAAVRVLSEGWQA